MKKFLLVFGIYAFAPLAAAAAYEPPVFSDLVLEPKREIYLNLDNTSGQPDSEALADIAAVLRADPQYHGDVIYLTVGGSVVTINRVMELAPQAGTIGIKEELKVSQWSRDVGQVISSATGGVSGSAKVGVTVTHKQTNKDGSSTETTVKVDIEVKGNRK